jgi:hypothetical protein
MKEYLRNLGRIEMVTEINLAPEPINTTRWFAHALATHSFVFGAYGSVASFMEYVRYLHQIDPKALQGIIDEMKAKPEPKKNNWEDWELK